MPAWDEATLTERQRKWFSSIRDGLANETGRPIEAWVEIARRCPETKPRARLKWLKDNHGLAQNRASYVLSVAFPSEPVREGDEAPLWSDPVSKEVFEAVQAVARRLPGALVGQRKSYTAFSKAFQFAAIRPVRTGGAMLGLALTPGTVPRLCAPKRESWSERLKSVVAIGQRAEVDDEIATLLRMAWERS